MTWLVTGANGQLGMAFSRALAERDDAVEDGFPVAIAGEVVVGDEERGHALVQVVLQDLLDVVGGAVARLAALDVDDGAEAALEGTAAAGVEAGAGAQVPANVVVGQDRDRFAL